jgi:hypothetical protein
LQASKSANNNCNYEEERGAHHCHVERAGKAHRVRLLFPKYEESVSQLRRPASEFCTATHKRLARDLRLTIQVVKKINVWPVDKIPGLDTAKWLG